MKRKFDQIPEKNNTVQVADHGNNVCEKLFSYCKTKEFSDVCVISSDDVSFNGHRNVLSASSDFFKTMFESDFKEVKECEVKIHAVNSEILKPVLGFVYTGTIQLLRTTIEDISKAANFLQIKSLIRVCCNYMEKDLDAGNCLEIAMFAEQYNFMELREKAAEFASTLFEDFLNGKEFLKLSEDVLSLIITSEDFWLPSEDKLVLTLIQWIEHDKPNRVKSSFKLFSKVHYWLLSLDCIKQNRVKICNQSECVELVFSWLEWHASDCSNFRSCSWSRPNPKRGKDKLVIISNNKKQTYVPKSNTWTCEDFTGHPNSFSHIYEVKNKLIFDTTPLHCFDLQTKQTTQLPQLDRANFALAVLENELYIIGGHTTQDWKKNIDKFNFSSGKWKTVANMNTLIQFPVAAVAGGVLYVDDRMGNTECFNPVSNTCTSYKTAAPNDNKTYKQSVFSSIIGVNEKLYNAKRLIKQQNYELRIFDHSTMKWKPEKIMRQYLLGGYFISCNDSLIVFDRQLCTIQEYNTESKAWRNLPQPNYSFIDIEFAMFSMKAE